MKVSQIEINNENIEIETTSDAIVFIGNEEQRQRYIATYGDVETERDNYGVYRVPSFAVQIEAFKRIKARACARYGSN